MFGIDGFKVVRFGPAHSLRYDHVWSQIAWLGIEKDERRMSSIAGLGLVSENTVPVWWVSETYITGVVVLGYIRPTCRSI